MGKADLHTHTLHSDGLLSPNALMIKAKQKGINWLSITDHDNISNIPTEIELAQKHQLNFMVGCEVSAYQGKKDYHILALNFEYENDFFVEHFTSFKVERLKRAEVIAHKFRTMGMNIRIEDIVKQAAGAPIGRPHIARAVIKAGYAKEQKEVFNKYLYDNGPAYQAKPHVRVKDIIDLIHRAGGIAVLAHPANFYNVDELEKVVNDGIDGIEIYHPMHNKDLVRFYELFANKYHLLMTGGSDYHGHPNDEYFLGNYFADDSIIEQIIHQTKIIRSKSIYKHVWTKLFSFD